MPTKNPTNPDAVALAREAVARAIKAGVPAHKFARLVVQIEFAEMIHEAEAAAEVIVGHIHRVLDAEAIALAKALA